MGSSPSSLYPKPVSTNPEGPKTLPPLRQKKIYDLMRTVSQLEAESPRGPDGVNRFVEWRIQVTEAKIELNQHSMKDLNESSEEGRVSNHDEYHHTMADLQEKRDVLDREWVQLLTQGQFLREDLQDMVVAKDTDIQQLYWHWSTPGDGGVADSRSKRRSKFDRAVKEYHGTERESGVAQPERWCPVLGVWLPKGHVKYTQIVPFTLQSNELSCMFGVRDAALNTARNGLPMKTNIEEAYDNGWVVILPDGSVQATPTQWKLVVINEDLFGKCVHRGGGTRPGGEWFWEDIDGRRLQFLTDNRPARRYLYFRYAMAWMHAEKKQWETLQTKMPSGDMWASPGKRNGYLRRSVLRALAHKIGDRMLPDDMERAGTFVDTSPPTETKLWDEVASVEISLAIRQWRKGAGSSKETEDSEDSEED